MQKDNAFLFGADAISLYPSLDKEITAEAIRREVVESEIKWEEVNWGEAGKYARINTAPGERRNMEVDGLVPRRRHTKAPDPKITGGYALSKGGEPSIK